MEDGTDIGKQMLEPFLENEKAVLKRRTRRHQS